MHLIAKGKAKAKERLGRRGKSPAASAGQQNNVSASSSRPDSLTVPSTATLEIRRSSTGSDAATGESLTHAATAGANEHEGEHAGKNADEHADKNTDEHAGDHTDESLWDRAYKALDSDMVADYDAVVAEVVKEQGETTNGDGKRAVQELVDETSQRGKTAYEAKKLQYRIFNKTLVASKLVSDAVAVIKRFKPIIDEAVKASAAASFAWVGVSLALGILANPQGVHEENLDGLAKVASAMHYYMKIEPLLLRQKQDRGTAAGVYQELEKLVVDLYTNILDFQCRSALRFYSTRLRRVFKDLRRADDWKAMLSKIETSEAVLKDRSAQVLALVAADDQRAAAERAADILTDARLQLKAQTETLRAMLDLEKKKELFEKVPEVPGARYDSYEDRAVPQCQEDTRISTLEEINRWIQTPGAQGVFWLSGPAGSGKSTISKTVAKSLDDRGRLGASYFFRQPDRRMADKVFSTIARQLVDNIPGFGVQLYKTLEKTSTPVSKLRHELQCKTLITDPLSGLDDLQVPNAPMVVIVDGLDECDNDSDMETLCAFLCGLFDAGPGRLLVFLASRDVRSIAETFETRDKRTYTHLDLRQKTEESVSDITAFVTKEFSKMAKKRSHNVRLIDDETLSRVIDLCTKPSPLFVFASTLCRSVSRNTSPAYQLNKWLNDRKNTAPESRLDELYASVIRQALSGDNGHTRYDENQRRDLLTIISSLMFLSQPQSRPSLAALLGMDPNYVNDMLDDFRPVVDIPDDDKEPIQILHTSFVEFMCGHRGHTVSDLQDFVADEDAIHSVLFRRCIVYMGENLKQDLCELGDPATSITDVNQSVLDAHIPAALQYACLFWSKHIKRNDESALSTVLGFLKEHLLHWIEAMALLGRIVDVALPMWELEMWATGELSQFMHDILAFHDAYSVSMIREFPLQAYGGALVWCPTSNMVRSTQWKHRLPVIESAINNRPNVKLRPSPMEGHKNAITAVAFSPRLGVVASSSYDWTVRLWNTKTRHCIGVLQVDREFVTDVAYSSDGETLATASDCIRIWDTSDYELKQSFGLDAIEPFSIVFVPGSDDLVARMSDGTMRAWDYKTGEAREYRGTTNMADYSYGSRKLVVSPNGRFLATDNRKTVFLFDAKTLSTLHRWEIPTREDVLTFSHDSQTLMAVASLRTWSVTSYESIPTLAIFDGTDFRLCAISSDGKFLAARKGPVLCVYAMDDITTQVVCGREALENAKPLLAHNMPATYTVLNQVCFSPDSKLLAFSNGDNLTLLDVPRSRQIAEDEEDHGIQCVRYSRDWQTFLAIHSDSVSVWNIANLQFQFATQFPFGIDVPPLGADISANDRYLALGLESDVYLFPQTHISAGAGAVDAPRFLLDVDREVDLAGELVQNTDSIRSLAFSPDSRTLAVGFNRGAIRLWDVATQKHTSTACDVPSTAHASVAWNLAFSADSLLLAVGFQRFTSDAILIYKLGENSLGPPLKSVQVQQNLCFDIGFEFWPGNRYLDIGNALVDLETCSFDSTEGRHRLPGKVYIVKRWLVRNGVRLLRLPSDSDSWHYKFSGTLDQIVLPFVRGGLVVVTLVPST